MSKRRYGGERVWVIPGAGFGGLGSWARIQGEDGGIDYCCFCDDPDCFEWATLITDDGDMRCHVNECQMRDEPEVPPGSWMCPECEIVYPPWTEKCIRCGLDRAVKEASNEREGN